MSPESYRHDPLDLNSSAIRLIRVLPNRSEEGYVQCTILHSDTNDDFTCLSYTWGTGVASRTILIDGQRFLVRSNLYRFLKVATEKYANKSFWIDALCIDQDSVKERNHQVARMGVIYSEATDVLVWLGDDAAIATFFQVWKDCNRGTSSGTWWHDCKHALLRVDCGWLSFVNSVYWTRAWITQELAAARTITFLAGSTELEADLLRYITKIPWYETDRIDPRCKLHIDIARGRRTLRGKSLFTLLRELPNQHCADRKDRVYSLLWLAAERDCMEVDYDISDLEFLTKVYEACLDVWCICSLGLLTKVLDLRHTEHGDEADGVVQSLSLNVTLEARSSRKGIGINKALDFCTFCPEQLPWSDASGPIFCLFELCPTTKGHLHLQNPKNGHTVHGWLDGPSGSFSWSESGPSWGKVRLQQASDPGDTAFKARFPIEFLLSKHWLSQFRQTAQHRLCHHAVRDGEVYWSYSHVDMQVKGRHNLDQKLVPNPTATLQPYFAMNVSAEPQDPPPVLSTNQRHNLRIVKRVTVQITSEPISLHADD